MRNEREEREREREESHTFNLWMMSDVMFEACIVYYIIVDTYVWYVCA